MKHDTINRRSFFNKGASVAIGTTGLIAVAQQFKLSN